MTGGNVTDQGSSAVTGRGLAYATHSNPIINDGDFEKALGSGTGVFTYEIDGMEPQTTYYVRAFAINSGGVAYGGNVEYTTSSFTDMGYPYETENCVVWISNSPSSTHDVIDNAGIPAGYLIFGWRLDMILAQYHFQQILRPILKYCL